MSNIVNVGGSVTLPAEIKSKFKDAEQPKIGSQQASPTLIAGMGVMNYGQSPYLALGEGDVLLGEIRLGTLSTEPCEANYMWGANVAAAIHIAKQSDAQPPAVSIDFPSKNPSPVTGKANNQLPPTEQPQEPPSKPTSKTISDVTRGFCR